MIKKMTDDKWPLASYTRKTDGATAPECSANPIPYNKA